MCWGIGYSIVKREEDADYSEYLGPNYNKEFKGKRVPTQICNHVTFTDILAWNAVLDEPPSYACADFVRHLPLGHIWTDAMACVYLKRDLDQEGRDKAVKALSDRQHAIMNGGPDHEYHSMCIFAEGTVSNGKNLLKFRRGGFASLLPVIPSYIRYNWNRVAPDYCTILGLQLCLLQFCEPWMNTCDAVRFPPFIPNEYLYTTYAKKIPDYDKLEKWEIYAYAVNDFISKAGGFGKDDQAAREKVKLGQFVRGQTNEITVNDKTFTWPPKSKTA